MGQNLQRRRSNAYFQAAEEVESFYNSYGLVCETVYLWSYLCRLLWVDGSHMLIVFECVLSVLLLRTDVLLQQAQHLTSLVAAVNYADYYTGLINLCVMCW